MNGLTGFCTPEHYDPQQFGFRKGHSTSHALNTKLLNESHIYIKLNLNKCMCLPNLSILVKPLIKYTTKYLYINYVILILLHKLWHYITPLYYDIYCGNAFCLFTRLYLYIRIETQWFFVWFILLLLIC